MVTTAACRLPTGRVDPAGLPRRCASEPRSNHHRLGVPGAGDQDEEQRDESRWDADHGQDDQGMDDAAERGYDDDSFLPQAKAGCRRRDPTIIGRVVAP